MMLTLLDSVLASLEKAAVFNQNETVPPAAVLWTDEKREWEALVPRFRHALPGFLVFGLYGAANRAGPAIWLRCVLAGRGAEISWPPTAVPILYLPGVSRATLRATEECPNELRPLAELQYRGVFWSQVNGKDWTVAAFLQTNHGGLQLKLARDTATATSIRRSIEKLVDVPLAELKARSAAGELNSSFFDSLISDDPIDDLLSWLSDPIGTRNCWDYRRKPPGRRSGSGTRSCLLGIRVCQIFCERPSLSPKPGTCLRVSAPGTGPRTTRSWRPSCARPCSRSRRSRSPRRE